MIARDDGNARCVKMQFRSLQRLCSSLTTKFQSPSRARGCATFLKRGPPRPPGAAVAALPHALTGPRRQSPSSPAAAVGRLALWSSRDSRSPAGRSESVELGCRHVLNGLGLNMIQKRIGQGGSGFSLASSLPSCRCVMERVDQDQGLRRFPVPRRGPAAVIRRCLDCWCSPHRLNFILILLKKT